MKPCPRKHSSVRTLLPWVHSAGEPHLANPHPMEHSIVVLVQRRHVAQSMAVQGMSYMGQIGPIVGRTPAPSTSIGPFRGDWIDRGTQVWVPKVIPGTPRCCLHPSLSAKRKRLGPLRLSRAIVYGLISTGGLQRILLRNCSQLQDPRCLHCRWQGL